MGEIERVFQDRIISRDLWLDRSPDMTSPAISVSGIDWKNARTNLRTLEELKRNIRNEINNNYRGELQRVMGNFKRGVKNGWTTNVDSSRTSVNKVSKYDNL